MPRKNKRGPKEKDGKKKTKRWSNASPAGILLIDWVNSDRIYDRMPTNVAMRESDLFNEYTPKAFGSALKRARHAKNLARELARKNKAHFGTSASPSTYMQKALL